MLITKMSSGRFVFVCSVEFLNNFLNLGNRLPRPNTVSANIWVLLIKCWQEDPESRPDFKDLLQELEMMKEDPNRFIVLVGDISVSYFIKVWGFIF